MSVSLVKPFITSKLTALGFNEWTDAFGEDNLPSTLIDKSFHYRLVSLDATSFNQETVEYNLVCEVKIYFKGFADTGLALDQSLVECENVIADLQNIEDQATSQIKGLFFDSMSLDPFDDALNDNIIVATLRFSVRVFRCIVI